MPFRIAQFVNTGSFDHTTAYLREVLHGDPCSLEQVKVQGRCVLAADPGNATLAAFLAELEGKSKDRRSGWYARSSHDDSRGRPIQPA